VLSTPNSPVGADDVRHIRSIVNPLTERERDVLTAAAEHRTAGEIARHLFLAEGTVRNYLSVAIRKLGARNRGEAVDIARDKGWL
jgi:two-component system, NarL family, response regulator DesR